MRKVTTTKFIERARQIHGNKYDYPKVEYKTSADLVTITCPSHGEFQKTLENHLHKTKPQGCPSCKKENKKYNQLTTEEFVERARKIHEDKYDYSKVNYINNHTAVCIICPKHGEFWQTPSNHLKSKHGCKLCANEKMSISQKDSTEEFIEKARKVHGDKYDYSKVEYVNSKTKVCIICPKHGEFWQKPDNHLIGRGCSKCKKEKLSKLKITNWDELVKKMQHMHNNKYKYCESTYVDTRHTIDIICPVHGIFKQTPHAHLRGQGCPKCNGGKKLTTEEFIEKAKKVHGNKYDYSKVNYINSDTNVAIICPKHGIFSQKPSAHLQRGGCQHCNDSHLEKEITNILNDCNLHYIHQNKFKWLGRQSLDFYLPQYNVAIECQGKQHFGLGGWTKDLNSKNKIQTRDIRKKQLCEENGVRLLYFSHEKFDEFLGEKIYHNVEELMEEIKNS